MEEGMVCWTWKIHSAHMHPLSVSVWGSSARVYVQMGVGLQCTTLLALVHARRERANAHSTLS